MGFHVTAHACQRYVERVEPVTLEVARQRIRAAAVAIEAACRMGCKCVVTLPCRARLVVENRTVITVKPPEPKRSARVGGRHGGAGHIRRNDKGRQKWRCSMEEMEQ